MKQNQSRPFDRSDPFSVKHSKIWDRSETLADELHAHANFMNEAFGLITEAAAYVALKESSRGLVKSPMHRKECAQTYRAVRSRLDRMGMLIEFKNVDGNFKNAWPVTEN